MLHRAGTQEWRSAWFGNLHTSYTGGISMGWTGDSVAKGMCFSGRKLIWFLAPMVTGSQPPPHTHIHTNARCACPAGQLLYSTPKGQQPKLKLISKMKGTCLNPKQECHLGTPGSHRILLSVYNCPFLQRHFHPPSLTWIYIKILINPTLLHWKNIMTTD